MNRPPLPHRERYRAHALHQELTRTVSLAPIGQQSFPLLKPGITGRYRQRHPPRLALTAGDPARPARVGGAAAGRNHARAFVAAREFAARHHDGAAQRKG
ncbi:hypothetical protein Rhe02_92100 [Rhizocola hellebori]|uniref:Uncharacterized protein n=1 Tax=Rhizocola hellebori TaxID=1392758 RepID=A0A8J3VMF1_9ACTN|nr:hypothetical protein Rhe02_92100 [Rhizocola hellebori]